MANNAPKPWKLTEDESFASYTSWQHTIVFNLSRDDTCWPFLQPGVSWLKHTASTLLRGLTDDLPVSPNGLSAVAKAANLHQMLGLITQWVPHYLATDITNNSTSMEDIWGFIRKYYGFQQSETQFM